MNRIYTSATKLCLLAIILALIIGLFTDKIANDQFMNIALMIVSFYFGSKVPPSTPNSVA